jgi:hypothetical protein
MRGANDFLHGTRSSTSARGRREAGLEGSAGERGTSRARRRDGRERVGTGDRAPGASGGETANPAPRFGAGGRAENTFPRSRSLARRARETRRTSKRARAFSAARLGTRTVRACPLVDRRVELWSGADDALAGWKNIEARTPPPDASEPSSLQRHATRDAGASKWTPGGKIFRGTAPRCGDVILHIHCSLGKVLKCWTTDE